MNRSICSLVLLAAVCQAQAGFDSGNVLYSQLQLYDQELQGRRVGDIVAPAEGEGFVVGVADALDGLADERSGHRFCIPRATARQQLVEAAFLYLRDHPAERNGSAWNAVVAGLAEKFPCGR